jgi:hypothetical protein
LSTLVATDPSVTVREVRNTDYPTIRRHSDTEVAHIFADGIWCRLR